MDQMLKTYFGLSLGQTNGVGLEDMIYLEGTDSYYKDKSYLFLPYSIDFTRGYWTRDGKVVLYYGPHSGDERVMTLVEAPEGAEVPYYVYSHLPSDFTPPGAEGFVADKTARSAKEFFSMLRDSQGEGEGLFHSVAYRDLTYVRYGVDRSYTYQVWYQGKLIAGPRSLFSIYGDYCGGVTNYYTVTYKNSEAFVFIYYQDTGADYYFNVQMFDTNGNVLFDGGIAGAPTFDEKTATLLDCNVSLKTSVDGEPMIAVTADPGNSDLSHYSDDYIFGEDE